LNPDATAVIEPVNNRVLPAKKDQEIPTSYGNLPTYGLTSLFYQPKMRSAYLLHPKQWSGEIGFAHSSVDSRARDATYQNASVDVEFHSMPFSLAYGFEWSEIELSGAVSQFTGDLDLVQTNGLNLIKQTEPKYQFDDVQLDIFIDLETLLFRSWGIKPKDKTIGKHTVSAGVKVPVGSESRYLSSGGMDFSFGTYNSYHVIVASKSIRWDLSAQLILAQNPEKELFNNKIQSRHFYAAQSIWATQIMAQTEGYMGVGYRSASLDGAFDAFQNDGAEYFLGLEQNIHRDGLRFKPRIQVAAMSGERYSVQTQLTFSY